MNILAELRSRFEQAIQPLTDNPSRYTAMVRPAGDRRFGDFQANCAMPLAKLSGSKPRDLAGEILSRLDVADLCQPPEIAGPGFINLTLRDDWIEQTLNRQFADKRLGVAVVARPWSFIIDYSSPNVAKPMHVGHLRSTVLGAAVDHILRFLGHTVVADNHIGDWGTQFGMIVFGYKHFRNDEAYTADAVSELARLYRLVNQLAEYHQARSDLPGLRDRLTAQQTELEQAESQADNDKSAKKALRKQRSNLDELRAAIAAAEQRCQTIENNPDLKQLADSWPNIAEQARQETARLHAGDEENRRLWEEFLPQCLKAIESMYTRLGVSFDLSLGESYYQPMLADVVDSLLEQGIATISEGAVCVFLEDNDAPFIVRKRDGAYTYATTDLATIKYRVEQLSAEEILYVVDARQSEHFRLLFETARRWGFDRTEYRHVSFGTILGDDRRPFKTRSGDTVGLESLLDEAVIRARQIVDKNDDARDTPELDDTTRAKVAEAVGIGGIKFADLKHNRDSDYVFDWDKMLATNGDTATYMQYAYARICGIFRKGNIDHDTLRNSPREIHLNAPEERALALQLLRFSEALEETVADFRPNQLTQYLFETANVFSTFYNACPVLKEPDETVRSGRLKLCDLAARILRRGLELLGIDACERM